MKPRTLLVARLWFEGNRFSPLPTDRAAFERCEWTRGDTALTAARGSETELAAVADFAQRRPDWRVVVSRCASACPGGPMDDDVFEAFAGELLHDLHASRPDAVYLSLHGAAITPQLDAPETALLRRVRAALGAKPLLASFDLHANADPAWAALLDFASAYRSYPHVDLRATAARVLDRLDALCAGRRHHGHIAKLGALLPSFRMRSDAMPMALLQARSRELEASHPGCDVAVLGGFPYADTPFADAGVMAWSDHAALSQRLAAELLTLLRRQQPGFDAALPTPALGLAQALALVEGEAARPSPRIVAVTDPADNPLSGGGADTPALLHELLAQRDRLPQPGNAGPTCVFAYFCDPGLVQRAQAAPVGAVFGVQLGGRLSRDFGAPVRARAKVLRFADGCFVNRGPMLRGQAVHAGPCALLELSGVAVAVTSAVVPANDPAFFEMFGLDLARVQLLCVKAKNHFHAAFAPLCAAIVAVDAPGPAMADLAQLPSRHWPRPARPAPASAPA